MFRTLVSINFTNLPFLLNSKLSIYSSRLRANYYATITISPLPRQPRLLGNIIVIFLMKSVLCDEIVGCHTTKIGFAKFILHNINHTENFLRSNFKFPLRTFIFNILYKSTIFTEICKLLNVL